MIGYKDVLCSMHVLSKYLKIFVQRRILLHHSYRLIYLLSLLTLSAVVAAVKQGWVPSYLPMVTNPGTSLCSSSRVNTGRISLSMFQSCMDTVLVTSCAFVIHHKIIDTLSGRKYKIFWGLFQSIIVMEGKHTFEISWS